MVILSARLEIAPAARTRFLAQMAVLIRASIAEDGCASFGCFVDAWSPNAFLVLEEWRDHAALDAHERSAHVAAFKAGVDGMVVARRPTRVYDVARVADLGA